MKKIKISNQRNKKKSYLIFLKNKRKKLNAKKTKSKKIFSKYTAMYFILVILFFIFVISIWKKFFKKQFFMKNKLANKERLKINSSDNCIKKNKEFDQICLIQIMNKYKRDNITWPIGYEIKYHPLMSSIDLKAFSYFMNPKNIYFEFGSGGSTNLASYYNLTVYSVESDVSWHEKLKKSNIKANFITIDLKTYNNGGNPGEGTTVEDWKKYIQAYKTEYNADIIYIDGRFRVACALDIFPKIRNDALMIMHDYVNREYYHVIEDYYFKIKTWDILAVFVKKSYISSIPEDIYNKYIYIKQ